MFSIAFPLTSYRTFSFSGKLFFQFVSKTFEFYLKETGVSDEDYAAEDRLLQIICELEELK